MLRQKTEFQPKKARKKKDFTYAYCRPPHSLDYYVQSILFPRFKKKCPFNKLLLSVGSEWRKSEDMEITGNLSYAEQRTDFTDEGYDQAFNWKK